MSVGVSPECSSPTVLAWHWGIGAERTLNLAPPRLNPTWGSWWLSGDPREQRWALETACPCGLPSHRWCLWRALGAASEPLPWAFPSDFTLLSDRSVWEGGAAMSPRRELPCFSLAPRPGSPMAPCPPTCSLLCAPLPAASSGSGTVRQFLGPQPWGVSPLLGLGQRKAPVPLQTCNLGDCP